VTADRASGILLHPTSLPGPHGIGDLGAGAYRFLDFLASAGQRLWQVLPLGPTGYGDSPYACFSSFAGNPLLVSLDTLCEWGVLHPSDLDYIPRFPEDRVDFGMIIQWKIPILRKAAARFLDASGAFADRFTRFREAEAWWLSDYSLFMALKTVFDHTAWNRGWDRDIALREPQAIARWRKELAERIAAEEAIQFFFFSQWDALRKAAGQRGIRIIGDLPIFTAEDSADVWANRDLFMLDREGLPTLVAGVPPDYFSTTGQLWGNPLYDWQALERQGFWFWVERIKAARRLFDFIRIDHFRGFEACWAVPSVEPTAERGRWEKVPGDRLFDTLRETLGELPIIAEDLGVITPEVNALRERFGFPGMRILQFAFDRGEAGTLSADNRFLPHNHTPDSVVYTGTHDNDTTQGWFESRSPEERSYLQRYAASSEESAAWRLIRMAISSVGMFSVIPLQDALGLGTQARMNTPGTLGRGNWGWRLAPGALAEPVAGKLRELAVLYGRAG
jgi:4-alpha-glucanotransferase